MKAADEAIVLVGGLGTRLRPVVDKLPKPLAPVAGRPFLAWVLDHLAQRRIRRAILATGYMGEVVHEVVGRQWSGMDVVYSQETEPLGTGGAIRAASARLLGDAVHVLNGDTFLAYDPAALEAFARTNDADIGVALAHVADVGRYGAATRRGVWLEAFEEKGGAGAGWINAGCYFLRSPTLSSLPDGPSSLETALLAPAVAAGRVVGYDDTSGFIDIGVPEDYACAQFLFPRVAE